MRFVIIPIFEASSLELLIASSDKLQVQGWCERFFFFWQQELKLLQDSAVFISTVGERGVYCRKMNECNIGW